MTAVQQQLHAVFYPPGSECLNVSDLQMGFVHGFTTSSAHVCSSEVTESFISSQLELSSYNIEFNLLFKSTPLAKHNGTVNEPPESIGTVLKIETLDSEIIFQITNKSDEKQLFPIHIPANCTGYIAYLSNYDCTLPDDIFDSISVESHAIISNEKLPKPERTISPKIQQILEILKQIPEDPESALTIPMYPNQIIEKSYIASGDIRCDTRKFFSAISYACSLYNLNYEFPILGTYFTTITTEWRGNQLVDSLHFSGAHGNYKTCWQNRNQNLLEWDFATRTLCKASPTKGHWGHIDLAICIIQPEIPVYQMRANVRSLEGESEGYKFTSLCNLIFRILKAQNSVIEEDVEVTGKYFLCLMELTRNIPQQKKWLKEKLQSINLRNIYTMYFKPTVLRKMIDILSFSGVTELLNFFFESHFFWKAAIAATMIEYQLHYAKEFEKAPKNQFKQTKIHSALKKAFQALKKHNHDGIRPSPLLQAFGCLQLLLESALKYCAQDMSQSIEKALVFSRNHYTVQYSRASLIRIAKYFPDLLEQIFKEVPDKSAGLLEDDIPFIEEPEVVHKVSYLYLQYFLRAERKNTEEFENAVKLIRDTPEDVYTVATEYANDTLAPRAFHYSPVKKISLSLQEFIILDKYIPKDILLKVLQENEFGAGNRQYSTQLLQEVGRCRKDHPELSVAFAREAYKFIIERYNFFAYPSNTQTAIIEMFKHNFDDIVYITKNILLPYKFYDEVKKIFEEQKIVSELLSGPFTKGVKDIVTIPTLDELKQGLELTPMSRAYYHAAVELLLKSKAHPPSDQMQLQCFLISEQLNDNELVEKVIDYIVDYKVRQFSSIPFEAFSGLVEKFFQDVSEAVKTYSEANRILSDARQIGNSIIGKLEKEVESDKNEYVYLLTEDSPVCDCKLCWKGYTGLESNKSTVKVRMKEEERAHFYETFQNKEKSRIIMYPTPLCELVTLSFKPWGKGGLINVSIEKKPIPMLKFQPIGALYAVIEEQLAQLPSTRVKSARKVVKRSAPPSEEEPDAKLQRIQ